MANRTQLNILSPTEETAIRAQQMNLRVAELAVISWPAPDSEEVHAWGQHDLDPAFLPGLDTWLNGRPLICSFVAEDGVSEFHTLSSAMGFGDKTVQIKFTNNPSEIERKLIKHEAGVRIEFFYYIAGLDIVKSRWVGTLRTPDEAEIDYCLVTADAGFTSPDKIIPGWIHASDCPLYFAPLLAPSQRTGYPCDYDLDLGGSRGLNDPATGQPYTDCDYTRNGCVARMGDIESWLGDDTVREATQIGGGKHQTTSVVEGQETRLKSPVPVVFGKFRVLNSMPLAIAREVNPSPKHQDKGTLRTLMEISAGPVKSVSEPLLMGEEPQGQDIRLGTQRQSQTVFSPNVLRYSRRAVANLNKNPTNPKQIQNSQINAEFTVEGQSLVRVYSNPTTFTETYTQLRAWHLLLTLLNDWWGCGFDTTWLKIQDFIWLADTGKQFNGVLTGATIQTVVSDFLTPAGWFTFFHDGYQRFLPMESLDLGDADIPVFTDGTRQTGLSDTIPTPNILVTSPEDGGKARIKISKRSSKQLPNEVTVIWHDGDNDFIERPSRFSDKQAQLAAGVSWGDNRKNRLPAQYSAAGVTRLTELIGVGQMYRDLGANNDGGLLNNCAISIFTYGLLPEAFNMHPGKVFKLLTKRLSNYKDKDGAPFKHFRCREVISHSNGEMEIVAQAYGEIFWNSECQPQSGYVVWDTPNAAVEDGPNGTDTQIRTVSGSLGADGESYSDSILAADVVKYLWEHTVLQRPASGSYNVWNAAGQIGFKIWNDGTLWVYHEAGIQTFGAGTVGGGDRLSVEFDKSSGTSLRRYKQNGILLRSETASGSLPPDNDLSGVANSSGVLIGDVRWEMYPCFPRDVIDPGGPGDVTEPQTVADSAFVLIDRLWRDQEFAAGVPGIYVAAAPTTRAYAWSAMELFRDSGAGYLEIYETTLEAIIGTVATVLAATEIGTETVDIDLQPGQVLASFSAPEVAAGAGQVYLGGEIFRYQTATQQSTTPNRWRLSVLSNRGERCTGAFKATHAVGDKFAFLDPAAVTFLPLEASEIGQARNYKGVTAGLNLANYSPLSFTFNAPNFIVTTPPDYNLSFDSVRNEVLHDWMPVDDACIVTAGLVYEIYEDASGSPGALLWSGTASEWREPVAGAGNRTYHFRAKTNYAAGSYIVLGITITTSADGGLFGEPEFGEREFGQ